MRGTKRDWAGVVQGKLTVIREDGRDEHGNVLWWCKCECGTETLKPNRSLAGGVKSCSPACGVAESNANRAKHGMWKSKEYTTWLQIKMRCLNKNNTHYHRYGGRGITICKEWADDFEMFLLGVGRAPTTHRASLDRIDNDGNYEPGNVRWSNPKEQSNNRGNNIRVEFRGANMTLAEVARSVGIPYHQVFQRYHRGLRGEDLVTRQKVGRKPKK
mgnify:CR=1 FL=1